jgi:hypothetical protein
MFFPYPAIMVPTSKSMSAQAAVFAMCLHIASQAADPSRRDKATMISRCSAREARIRVGLVRGMG